MLRRAQNSSVVSNASSASFNDTHFMSGPGLGFPVPTPQRRRTSSNTSQRGSFSQTSTAQGSTSAPIPISQSYSAYAASVLEAARNPRGTSSMSRQNSSTSHRSDSRNRSPQRFLGPGFPHSSHPYSYGFPQDHTFGYSARDRGSSNASMVPTPGSEFSPGLMQATPRYEETAYYRHELDSARRENEILKKRVKDLERMLRERKDSDAGAGCIKTESTGTNTVVGGSTGITGDRQEDRRDMNRATSAMSNTGMSVGVGVPEEELKLGDSASNTHH